MVTKGKEGHYTTTQTLRKLEVVIFGFIIIILHDV